MRASFRHLEFGLSALAFALVVLLLVTSPVQAQVEKYSSKGKLVRIDWYRPLDDKRKPIVLILYGASGGGDSDYFSGCAQQFADAVTYSQQKFGKTRKIDFFGYSLGAQLNRAYLCQARALLRA